MLTNDYCSAGSVASWKSRNKPDFGMLFPRHGDFLLNSWGGKSYKKRDNGAQWWLAKKFWRTGKILPKSSKLSTLTSPIRLMIGVTIIKEI
jgi:hypothetical protein